jgi:DNA-binding NtrC family response regulator
MDRGRILILGNSKETTYEIRSLLDNHQFELEIALSPEVGKSVLANRQMNLIMIHSEMLQENNAEILEYLRDRSVHVPVVIMGGESELASPTLNSSIRRFVKPYSSIEVLSYIREL